MAETLGSAVLIVSVFDSDALVLRLLDPASGVDALAKAGLTKEHGISGRSNLSAWKPYVSDVKQFKKRLSEDHVLVEEILEEIAELLCLPASVSLTDYPTLTQMASPSCGAEYLYFKLSEKTEKHPPRLVWHCPGLLPQQIGEPQCFSFLNRGGAMFVCLGIDGGQFTMAAFLAGAVVNAVPGIIAQIVLIPVLVMLAEDRIAKA